MSKRKKDEIVTHISSDPPLDILVPPIWGNSKYGGNGYQNTGPHMGVDMEYGDVLQEYGGYNEGLISTTAY